MGTALTGCTFTFAWHCDRCGLEHEEPLCPLDYYPDCDYNAHDENALTTHWSTRHYRKLYRTRDSIRRAIANADALRVVQEALWERAKDIGIIEDFDHRPIAAEVTNQTEIRNLCDSFHIIQDLEDVHCLQEALWSKAWELGLEPEYPCEIQGTRDSYFTFLEPKTFIKDVKSRF